jgi:DNA repair protein RecN (Recombination protein N)
MLKHIDIQNYALIQHVRLDLHQGLTAITGETGSGKSIIMGALGLLLGDRADLKSLVKSDAKCVVEAQFDLAKVDVKDFFADNDLDADHHTTVRREITPAGKSRAFINDTPVSIQTLKEFGELVIDIHSQHENQLITQRLFRYTLVDAFNEDQKLYGQYTRVFHQRQKLVQHKVDLEQQLNQLLKEQDYRLFQLNELDQLPLTTLDQLQLEAERDELSNADGIQSGMQQALQILEDEPSGLLQQLRSLRQTIQKISIHSTRLVQFDERLNSQYLDLKELTAEMTDYADHVQGDPKKLEQLHETLSLLYQLQNKHRVNSVNELISLQDTLRAATQSTETVESQLESLKKEIEEVTIALKELAEKLTAQRKKSAAQAAGEIRTWFDALGLEQAKIEFIIKPSADYHGWGQDEIEWQFSANQGVPMQPLHKVASGGEISRVMLAIKATLSQRKSLPILILDEIDQGVSGEVGKKIGQVLKSMSSQMQLLTITHLAQIAGQADQQLKVSKRTSQGQTNTCVEHLSAEERIEELAEMISGKTKTEASLANARELLN